MDFVMDFVNCVNKFLWDYALLFLLVGAGVIFTVSLRKLFTSWKKRRKRTQLVSGTDNCYCSSGRYGKYCRCGDSDCFRRGRRHILDVGQCIFRYGDNLR